MATYESAHDRRRDELAILALVMAELTEELANWQDALRGWNVRESQTALRFIDEGRVLALQESLRKFLEIRFGVLPPAVIERIEATRDVERLRKALYGILDLGGPEDLEL
jgi:hypothetical protein